MSFVPHTEDERIAMMSAIGISDLSDLFSEIPANVRYPKLGLPPAMSPLDAERYLEDLAGQNCGIKPNRSFLGAGSYHHYIPAMVGDVLSRPEFYSAYTPYQPEVSQGMLQATFEYQSMVCALTGMEVSNASHYDGATALAEAALLSLGAAENGATRIAVSSSVNPDFRRVVKTYLQSREVEVVDGEDLNSNTAALIVQSPDFYGQLAALENQRTLAKAIHNVGGLLIVIVDPISLGLFKPPADYGADIVVADGQSLGMPPSFGGPSLGIFALNKKHVRRLVGRLVAETRDDAGRRGFVLTLGTREQHIRRARATSNICTNAALGALAAAVYLATLGESGLRQVGELCYQKSHYLADKLESELGLKINPQAPSIPWFKEFVVELPISARDTNTLLLRDAGIIGGLDLGSVHSDWNNRLLIAATEIHTRADLDYFVNAIDRGIV